MCCLRSTKGNNDQSTEDLHWEGSEKKALAQSPYGNVAFLHISRYPLLMRVGFSWPQGLSRLLWMDAVCRQVGGEGRCKPGLWGAQPQSFPQLPGQNSLDPSSAAELPFRR